MRARLPGEDYIWHGGAVRLRYCTPCHKRPHWLRYRTVDTVRHATILDDDFMTIYEEMYTCIFVWDFTNDHLFHCHVQCFLVPANVTFSTWFFSYWKETLIPFDDTVLAPRVGRWTGACTSAWLLHESRSGWMINALSTTYGIRQAHQVMGLCIRRYFRMNIFLLRSRNAGDEGIKKCGLLHKWPTTESTGMLTTMQRSRFSV